MRSESDVMDLLDMILSFYNSYRETLGWSHQEAVQKIHNMYSDIHKWLY